jgi:predicted O-methyltransferase YrrM
MIDILVPDGAGILSRKRRIKVDDAYARFLATAHEALLRTAVDRDVVSHCVELLNRENKQGLITEFGVFRGVSLNKIATLMPDRTIFGFDSFEGLPDNWMPGFSRGVFSLGGTLPAVKQNVQLVKGWFDVSIPHFLSQQTDDFAFIHVDTDLYASCMSVLRGCAKRIRPGTIIAFDEIWNRHELYSGEMRALFDFVKETSVRFEWIASGYDTGCVTRMPHTYGKVLGLGVKALARLKRVPARLRVAAAIRIL